jgi:uncharacterized phage-associated protein
LIVYTQGVIRTNSKLSKVDNMPNHSASAIANEFLLRRDSSVWPQQMLIQKLVYIANGWNLAISGERLVNEAPEAWDNGPVFSSLWRAVKDYGYQGTKCLLVNPFTQEPWTVNLTPSEDAILDHVWRKYGNYSALQLSNMTHEPNTPWSNAYLQQGRNAKLDQEETRQHYVDLALAGRG